MFWEICLKIMLQITTIDSVWILFYRRSSLAKIFKKGKLKPLNQDEDNSPENSLRPSALPEIQQQERPEPIGSADQRFESDRDSEDKEEDGEEEDEDDEEERMRKTVFL